MAGEVASSTCLKRKNSDPSTCIRWLAHPHWQLQLQRIPYPLLDSTHTCKCTKTPLKKEKKGKGKGKERKRKCCFLLWCPVIWKNKIPGGYQQPEALDKLQCSRTATTKRQILLLKKVTCSTFYFLLHFYLFCVKGKRKVCICYMGYTWKPRTDSPLLLYGSCIAQLFSHLLLNMYFFPTSFWQVTLLPISCNMPPY